MAYPYKAPVNKKSDVWFGFGSLANAFGLANHGKGMTAEEVAKAADVLYEKANELVKKQETASAKTTAKATSSVPEIEL